MARLPAGSLSDPATVTSTVAPPDGAAARVRVTSGPAQAALRMATDAPSTLTVKSAAATEEQSRDSEALTTTAGLAPVAVTPVRVGATVSTVTWRTVPAELFPATSMALTDTAWSPSGSAAGGV